MQRGTYPLRLRVDELLGRPGDPELRGIYLTGGGDEVSSLRRGDPPPDACAKGDHGWIEYDLVLHAPACMICGEEITS